MRRPPSPTEETQKRVGRIRDATGGYFKKLTRPQCTLTPQVPGTKASNMENATFILGLLAGIAFYFLFDTVRDHQRRKRRRLQNREAIRNRYY